jgi:predicted DNA-binding transcriptional regulator AlpA
VPWVLVLSCPLSAPLSQRAPLLSEPKDVPKPKPSKPAKKSLRSKLPTSTLPRDNLGEREFVGTPYLCTRYGVRRETIWRWLATKKLPAGIYLAGSTRMRWRVSDLLQWEEAQRDVSGAA